MENENLIGVYLKLLSVLECPVCLEYLTKPVALCNEGHALCSKCKSNISSCPMCRNPISSTRGLILDQIIETLLYPCYKMGCGSLLKRPEAENHDLNCSLENAADKQAVLHNNLLKNIEENFGSFIVQPEIVKETRTVGTVTGKVKTADARVQTAIPFTSSLILEKSIPTPPLPSTGCGLSVRDLPKAGPSTGISICSYEKTPGAVSLGSNAGFNQVPDLSKLEFSFPQTISFGQNPFTFSAVPSSKCHFEQPHFNSILKDSCDKQKSKPFFGSTSGIENNPGDIPRNCARKPSTNLGFSMDRGPVHKGASNDFSIRNEGACGVVTNDSIDLDQLASGSSAALPCNNLSNDATFLDLKRAQNDNKASKSKPSTNLTTCSSLVNSVSGNNSEPSLASTHRKRPTTNLCSLTTLA